MSYERKTIANTIEEIDSRKIAKERLEEILL